MIGLGKCRCYYVRGASTEREAEGPFRRVIEVAGKYETITERWFGWLKVY